VELTRDEVYRTTLADISEARSMIGVLQDKGFIRPPDVKLLEDARDKAIAAVTK
jgi:hypothetical protein